MYIDFLFSLNFSEIFFLTIPFLICMWDLAKNFQDKNWINFFKPTSFFGLLIIFYCLVGPILSSALDDGSIMYRGVNHREFYEIGLIASFLTYLSFQIGFNYKNFFKIQKFGINKLKEYSLKTKDYLFMFKWGERIVLFTLLLQFLTYGSLLIYRIFSTNQTAIYTRLYGGFASGYFSSSVNFLIVGIILLFISLLNGIKERTKFIFYFSITVGLFLNLGFRYRLLLLLLRLILIYFFYKKVKPNLSILLGLFLSTIFAFGFIQIARDYGLGISYEKFQSRVIKAQSASGSDTSVLGYVFKEAFFDTNVFHTSAGIIHKTPELYNYVGLKPLINAVTLPIPRILWAGKPSGEYMKKIYKIIYEGYQWEVGAANLGFAEYYLSGGWIALIITNFFLGLFFKKIWLEFLNNFNDPISQLKYVLFLSYLYVVFTRGYLLQFVYIYFSIFLPFYFFSYIWNKRFR